MLARAIRLALGLLLAASAPALASTPIPLGPQFQVNTHTTSVQLAEGIAMTPDGEFIVVWGSLASATDPGDTDLNDTSVQAQRYAADGSPLGAQFQVDSIATGVQGESSVAMADDGDFVITWSDIDSIVFPRPSLYEVMAQRYAAGGSPSGVNFQVNAVATGYQFHSDVAIASDGDFVVVWEDKPVSGPRTLEARLFDAAGSPVSAEIPIVTNVDQAVVAAAPNGDFTVVWSTVTPIGSDTSSRSVQARRYAADGSPLGATFLVNSYTTGAQLEPAVAVAPDGSFVIVWHSQGSAGTDTSEYSVQGQRFAANGLPIGSEFQVNTWTTGSQGVPSVATNADGDFVVVWQNRPELQPPAHIDILGQHFAADGSPLGSEFQVNTYTGNPQYGPVVAAGNEGFVVAWTSFGSPGTDTAQSVQARRYLDGVATEVPSLSAPLAVGCAVLLLAATALGARRATR